MPVVQIEKPANQTLATWFSELRSWFDVNHCEPRGFTASGRRVDRLVYLISFDDVTKARRFSQNFSQYARSCGAPPPTNTASSRRWSGAKRRSCSTRPIRVN